MVEYINKILPKIKALSQKIDTLAKLYDEPWVVLNDTMKIQKLIFQKNNELIVSINGIVTMGQWKYLNQANSILIDVNNEKRLYNHQFVDTAVMIWQLDGTISEYFMLVNQNIIPNLDIIQYIEGKYMQKSSPNFINTEVLLKKKIELTNGDKIEIYTNDNCNEGKIVMLNNCKPENGIYKSTEFKRYEIVEGKILYEYFIETIKQSNGLTIEIDVHRMKGIGIGSRVWLNDFPAPNGTYKKSFFSKIEVIEGKIIKIK